MLENQESNKYERELVLRLINGDEDAFCSLYALYKDRLVFYSIRFLKSQESAEDLFQDAFTLIWQSRQFLNPDLSFQSYLYKIIRNRILNQLRDLDNHEKMKNDIMTKSVDYSNETLDNILTTDLQNLLNEGMNKLTDRQRQIFKMSREKDMTHKEIAEQLNISVNTVQQSISTSLSTLRDFLKKHYITNAELILLLFFMN